MIFFLLLQELCAYDDVESWLYSWLREVLREVVVPDGLPWADRGDPDLRHFRKWEFWLRRLEWRAMLTHWRQVWTVNMLTFYL